MLPGANPFTIHSREDFQHLLNTPLRVISPRGTPLSGMRHAFSCIPQGGLSPPFHLQLAVAHVLNKIWTGDNGLLLRLQGLTITPVLAPVERFSPQRAQTESFPTLGEGEADRLAGRLVCEEAHTVRVLAALGWRPTHTPARVGCMSGTPAQGAAQLPSLCTPGWAAARMA